MIIVDSQIHISPPNTAEHPWTGDSWPNHRPEALAPAGFLAEMDEAGVSRAVLVPTSWGGGNANPVAIAAVEAHPGRLAIMGQLGLTNPTNATLLPDWRRQPGMLGVRLAFTRDSRALLTDGTADWFWPAAEKANLPVMVLPPGLVRPIGAIAENHPGLRFVIDHLALETRGPKGDAAFRELPDLLALARLPNVAVKASALPTYTTETYPFTGLHKYIRMVFDAFGPRRMFWGSDLSRLRSPYRQLVTLFTEELPWLSDDDKEWIMGRGICEWLDWPLGPALPA